MKHKSESEMRAGMPGVARVGAAGPVALDELGGVLASGTGGGEAVVGLARPSKPGMAELGMLKLSCSRCLPGPAHQRKDVCCRQVGAGLPTDGLSAPNFGQGDDFLRPPRLNSSLGVLGDSRSSQGLAFRSLYRDHSTP